MTYPAEQLRAILERCKRIAILGISEKPSRPGHYVPAYLHSKGYEIHGVNPNIEGHSLFDRKVVANLSGLEEPVDLIDVFRRTEHLPAHVDEILALEPLPPVVWLQKGIRSETFAGALESRGVEVVQDRCTLAEHRRLLGG